MKRKKFFSLITLLFVSLIACKMFQPTTPTQNPALVTNTPKAEQTKTPEPTLALPETPPTEGWIAFGNKYSIWLAHPDGSGLTRIANFSPAQNSDFFVVSNVIWSPDGKKLAYAELIGEETTTISILIYDAQTATTTTLVKEADFGFMWSNTGKQIIYRAPTFSKDGEYKPETVLELDVENGDKRQIFEDYYFGQWSYDRSRVIISRSNGEKSVLDLMNGKRSQFVTFSDNIYSCEWAPNELTFACNGGVSGADHKLHPAVVLFDVNGKRDSEIPLPDKMDACDVHWSPDGEKLVLGCWYLDEDITKTGIFFLSLDTQEITPLASGNNFEWSPDGQWVVTWVSVRGLQPDVLVVNTTSGKSFLLGEGNWATWQP